MLGSGSSGNCSLLRFNNKWCLIDCGLSLKQTKMRMKVANLNISDINDLVLTHLDYDHFNPAWCRAIQTHGICVYTHKTHVKRALKTGIPKRNICEFEDTKFSFNGGTLQPIHVSHDALGTFCFVFDSGSQRLGFATDLGHVPDKLIEKFIDLDIVAFESNYDPSMQLASRRPQFLKDRIMDGSGHLSNGQSLKAIKTIAQSSKLKHIILLHLSRQCNKASLIRELYNEHCPDLVKLLTISAQDYPSEMLKLKLPAQPEQLALF